MPRIELPLAQWPERYRADWERLTAPPQSLYDDGAAAARLRPQTLVSYRKSLGCWLGFLGRHGWLRQAEPLADTVTPERLDLFVAELRARGNGNVCIKTRLGSLHTALRHLAPQAAIGFIRRPGGIALDRALPSNPRRVAVRDFRELLDLACQLYQEGLAKRSTLRGKEAIRDAAILGLLALYGPRVTSLVAIEIGEHLTRRDGGYWLRLKEDIVKTETSISYPLDDVLTPILDTYLGEVRPAFGGEGTTSLWLWITGTGLCARTVAGIVHRRTRAWFGEGRGPHWFRKCLTTTVTLESPELALDAARILGHGPEVAIRHYNMASASAALRRHGSRLSARRRATAGLAARAFREEGVWMR
jgi:site-specific recombinase XerC